MATTTMIVDTSTLSPESGGCWSGSEAHRSTVYLRDDGARDPLLLIGYSSTDVLWIRNRRARRWVRARHSYVWYGIYLHIESVLIGPGISGGDNWTKWVTVWGFNVTSTIDTILLLWVIQYLSFNDISTHTCSHLLTDLLTAQHQLARTTDSQFLCESLATRDYIAGCTRCGIQVLFQANKHLIMWFFCSKVCALYLKMQICRK